jgi:Reverse transcriptase (RNA-dependent DNA polymerase).
MINEGFKRSQNDLCLYIKDEMYVLIYVDDVLIFCNNEHRIMELKNKFQNTFKMKNLGIISKYLGMQITRDENSLKINQTQYIQNMLKKFNMSDCKSISTPIEPNYEHVGEHDPNYENLCRSALGALLYLSLCSRPDITVAVNVLSRFQTQANVNLWNALKRTLRYLKGTSELCLVFLKNKLECLTLECYADADWAGDKSTRRSTSGFIIQINGCTVLWQSRRQNSVSLSTAESEYVALSEACSDVVWVTNILNDMSLDFHKPINIFEDNQSAMKMVVSQSKRAKHIDIRYHFVREKAEENLIKLVYIDTNNQIGDLFTKPLHAPKFVNLRKKVGVE